MKKIAKVAAIFSVLAIFSTLAFSQTSATASNSTPTKFESLKEKLARIGREKMDSLDPKSPELEAPKIEQKEETAPVKNSEIIPEKTEESFSLLDENLLKEYAAISEKSKDASSQNASQKDELIEKLQTEIANNKRLFFENDEKLAKAFSDSQKLYIFQTDKTSIKIVSESPTSARFISDIAQKIEKISTSFFPKEVFENFKNSESPIPRLEIHVLDSKNAKFNGDFLETRTRFGGRKISVKLRKEIPLDELCERLLTAHLRCVATILGRQSQDKLVEREMPYFVNLALKTALARELSIAIIQTISDFSESNTPDLFTNVLKYEKSNSKNLYFKEISSYWTLLALKSMMPRDVYYNFLKLSISEKSPEVVVKKLSTWSAMSEETFLDTLRMAQIAEVMSRYGGVRNFEQSEAEILRLSAVLKTNDGLPMSPVFVSDIFENADEFKDAIKVRIEEIKYNLTWINPAYINVLISLGQMYEAANLKDLQKYEAAKISFKQELVRARKIAELSGKLINGSQEN